MKRTLTAEIKYAQPVEEKVSEDHWSLFTWNIIEYILTFLIFVVVLPLMIVISFILLFERKGPIFYVSTRIGQNKEPFRLYKFRTMQENAEESFPYVSKLNQYTNGEEVQFHKFENDPRITRIGKWLRKTSLDELPQLLNVLKGDMNLVGNRPLPEYEAQDLLDNGYHSRFKSPSGITGWWQIQANRHSIGAIERIRLDDYYTRHRSFSMNMKILLATIPAMFQGE